MLSLSLHHLVWSVAYTFSSRDQQSLGGEVLSSQSSPRCRISRALYLAKHPVASLHGFPLVAWVAWVLLIIQQGNETSEIRQICSGRFWWWSRDF